MNRFWHHCLKLARSTWAMNLPQPVYLGQDSGYSWCRIPIKTYTQKDDVVISVPMPADLVAESIRIVAAPRTIGLRLCKAGGTVSLSRSFSVSIDVVEPITWQLDDGLLFIRLPILSADRVTFDQGVISEEAHPAFRKVNEAAALPLQVGHRALPKLNQLESSKSSISKSWGNAR